MTNDNTFREENANRDTVGRFGAKQQMPPAVKLEPMVEAVLVDLENSNEEWTAQLYREHGVPSSEAALLAAIDQTKHVEDRIRAISEESGLGGIMPSVFQVIRDREELSDGVLMALTSEDVTNVYSEVVACGMDDAELWLNRRGVTEGAAENAAEVSEHLRNASEEAGFGGVMPEVFALLRDRETVSDAILLSVSADDVAELYEYTVEPMIDKVVQSLQSGN